MWDGRSVEWWWWLIQFVVSFWIPSCHWALNLCGGTSHKLISGCVCPPIPWRMFFFTESPWGLHTRWPLIWHICTLAAPLRNTCLWNGRTRLLTAPHRRAGMLLTSSTPPFTHSRSFVCCRELRLLPYTMSEHVQLCLAFCRIGLYTVRKHTPAAVSFERTSGVLHWTCTWWNTLSFFAV